MAAFNWVELEHECPACRSKALLRAQTHVASSFSGTTHRFMDRTYRLDERFAWWPADDRRYALWKQNADAAHTPLVREACHATCLGCNADLCVVLEFEELAAVRVLGVSLESQWPRSYTA